MKFILTCSSRYVFTNKQKKDYEYLGFKLIKEDNPVSFISKKKDEVYRIDKTKLPLIEFQTLEELVGWVSKRGSITLSPGEIEIYDDYRE